MPVWQVFSYAKWQKRVQAISIFTHSADWEKHMQPSSEGQHWRYEEPTVTAKVLFPQQESLQLQSEYHLSG